MKLCYLIVQVADTTRFALERSGPYNLNFSRHTQFSKGERAIRSQTDLSIMSSSHSANGDCFSRIATVGDLEIRFPSWAQAAKSADRVVTVFFQSIHMGGKALARIPLLKLFIVGRLSSGDTGSSTYQILIIKTE
jgi:hypothetical protein